MVFEAFGTIRFSLRQQCRCSELRHLDYIDWGTWALQHLNSYTNLVKIFMYLKLIFYSNNILMKNTVHIWKRYRAWLTMKPRKSSAVICRVLSPRWNSDLTLLWGTWSIVIQHVVLTSTSFYFLLNTQVVFTPLSDDQGQCFHQLLHFISTRSLTSEQALYR